MNIIITGGTRCLGLSHAKYLSSKGYSLALIDISEKACQIYGETKSIDELLNELSVTGGKNKFYKCDLTNFELTKKVFKKIIDDYKQVHASILCVGGDVIGKDSNAAGGKANINNFEIEE